MCSVHVCLSMCTVCLLCVWCACVHSDLSNVLCVCVVARACVWMSSSARLSWEYHLLVKSICFPTCFEC